jgi:hypothetical protein
MAVSKEEIEKIIETKFNQFLKEVPNLKRDIKKEIEKEEDFFNFSIKNTYQNTIQTIIDIIDDTTRIIDNSNTYNLYLNGQYICYCNYYFYYIFYSQIFRK